MKTDFAHYSGRYNSSRKRQPNAALFCPLFFCCAPFFVFLLFSLLPLFAEDATRTYTVQISATVQTSPPQITLNWENNDPYGVQSFSIYRKAKDATTWNFLTTVGASTFSWTDTSVAAGSAYEYQIIKTAASHTGYG